MALRLEGDRSILMIYATHLQAGVAASNIVSHCGACIISRHLRDILVTEYGVNDLRSQAGFLAEAKVADKECYVSLIL
jgi:acyl-CoA hydrolase